MFVTKDLDEEYDSLCSFQKVACNRHWGYFGTKIPDILWMIDEIIVNLNYFLPMTSKTTNENSGEVAFKTVSGWDAQQVSLRPHLTVSWVFQNHVVQGLRTYTQYLVSLQVFNPEGDGPSSTVAVMTDEGSKYLASFVWLG